MQTTGIIKYIVRRLGLDIRLVRNIHAAGKKSEAEKWMAQWRFLHNYNVKTIIDIGANTGQFASMIHQICPTAQIYSFEPLYDCFKELEQSLTVIPQARSFNLALGDESGTIEMNQSEFSPSSSLLEMTDLHKRDWPQSKINTKQKIKVERLDDVAVNMKIIPDLIIKMDVQGFEGKVIQGGIQTINRARLVIAEINFEELYFEQPVFDDIYCIMRKLGFCFKGVADQHLSKIDGRFLFADAVFEKA